MLLIETMERKAWEESLGVDVHFDGLLCIDSPLLAPKRLCEAEAIQYLRRKVVPLLRGD